MQEMEQGYKRKVKRVLEGGEQDVAKGGVEGASQRLGAGWVYRAIHSTEREESTVLKQARSVSVTYQVRHHRRCSAQTCMSARIRLEKALRSPAGPDEIVRECTKRLRAEQRIDLRIVGQAAHVKHFAALRQEATRALSSSKVCI